MIDFFHPYKTFDEIEAELDNTNPTSVSTAHCDRALHFFRKRGDRPNLEVVLEVADETEDVEDWRDSELYKQLPFLLALNVSRREVISTREATTEISNAAKDVVRMRRPEKSIGVPDTGFVPGVNRAQRRSR